MISDYHYLFCKPKFFPPDLNWREVQQDFRAIVGCDPFVEMLLFLRSAIGRELTVKEICLFTRWYEAQSNPMAMYWRHYDMLTTKEITDIQSAYESLIEKHDA